MKTKLLVLDAFTNGHEAALRFIRRRGCRNSDFDIIFCGSHAALFARLAEGPALAVVPIRNSLVGPVTEVIDEAEKYRMQGYQFTHIDTLDLQVNHCLLAQKHVRKASDLKLVVSHEKAVAQCSRFLKRHGIASETAGYSTGNAAKRVSRLGPDEMVGAIAPRKAAKAYGLKVLAEYIQDKRENVTTFALIENKAAVSRKGIGIIGIKGGFGSALKAFFERLGLPVIGSDPKDPSGLSNEEVVKRSDVVVFAVSIGSTVKAIRSLVKESRPDQLFMDVTSVKAPAIKAMLKSKAQVVGLHPMFAPDVSFEGQTIVACPARLDDLKWKTWTVNMLSATGAKVKWSDGETHDLYMATVQGQPHIANMANAVLITEEGISAAESLTYTSPFYRVTFSLMGRLLSQDPDLYAGLLMKNPATVPMLRRRIEIEKRLLSIIERKDLRAFRRLFNEVKEHFGSSIAKEANELFLRLIAVTKTVYGKNSAVLEFSRVDDQPGLLERVARVFRRREVNLTGINSVILDGGRIQFTLSFAKTRSSDSVRLALEEIEGWSEPLVKVIS